MQINVAETIKEQGLNLHLIETKKFKTIHIIVKLSAPLERSTITKRALIPYLLNQGTEKYRSEKELQSKLDELYGANLSIDGMKKGDNHIISFRLEVVNDRFINNETTLIDDSIELLHDIIYSPNVDENVFPEKVFQREKKILINEIRSIVDQKSAYANMRLIDEMFEDNPYQIHVQGYEEDLEILTTEDVYQHYEDMLIKDRIDIYVLGQIDRTEIKQRIIPLFTNNKVNRNEQLLSTMIEKTDKLNEVIETEPINQAKLHIGYTTNCMFKDANYYALHVFNGLFGGFPNSKLFVNVREQNSLAYYISSRLESHKGLLIVVCGIDGGQYEQTKQIIDQELNKLKDGQFSDEELAETKKLIISQLKETLDNAQGIVELLFQQVLGEKQLSPNELIANIANVTKDDVIQVAQNIQEHTVFLLKNERN